MDLSQMIDLQRDFDAKRETAFAWSSAITASDPSALAHNALSLAGEVGEVANLVKKFERGDFDFEQLMAVLPGELADVLIYILKISYQSSIDLESAFMDKLRLNEKRFPVSGTGD